MEYFSIYLGGFNFSEVFSSTLKCSGVTYILLNLSQNISMIISPIFTYLNMDFHCFLVCIGSDPISVILIFFVNHFFL